ncbi:MAG: hypothetical protein RMJ43_03965 [Chloroherpetonaceae bacterium]|nr:hypothetical protein [Chloroherpetonaceae bacterium]
MSEPLCMAAGCWHTVPEQAHRSACALYRPVSGEPALLDIVQETAHRFLKVLRAAHPVPPRAQAPLRDALVQTACQVLHDARVNPAVPRAEQSVRVALRPVHHLPAGAYADEVCALLYDYHRGFWTPYLTRPQLWIIERSIAGALVALPPDALYPFWNGLHSTHAAFRDAMHSGLQLLREAHATSHLIQGLMTTKDHNVRAAIVDCLEEIGDPRSLAPLRRLRQETAGTDWTLCRQITRTIRVIERQNHNHHHLTLLRAAQAPADAAEMLLRPAADPCVAPQQQAELLRGSAPGEEAF